LSLYKIDSANQRIEDKIVLTALVINSNDKSAAQIAALNNDKIQVASNCQAVRIDDIIYYRNPSNVFTKSASPTITSSAVFDSSLNFVFVNNAIHKLTTNGYSKILDVSGLFSTV